MELPLDLAVWKLAPPGSGTPFVLKPARAGTACSSVRLAELASKRACRRACSTWYPASSTAGARSACTRTSTSSPSPDPRDRQAVPALRGGFQPSRSGWSAAARARTWCSTTPTWMPRWTGDLRGVYNQGAVCSSNSRLLLHAFDRRRVPTELVRRTAEVRRAIRWIRIDAGCPRRRVAHQRVVGFIERARADGEIPHRGRTREKPSMVVAVSSHRRSSRTFARCRTGSPDEVFGPVLAVQTFGDDRGSCDGHDTSTDWPPRIWTATCLGAFASRRHFTRHRLGEHRRRTKCQTPFGGFSNPVSGRDLSLHALEKYTGLKTTWIAL